MRSFFIENRLNLFLVSIILFFISFLLPSNTQAHFNLNVNIRLFHIVHEKGQIRLLVRIPFAYLVADQMMNPLKLDGTMESAPYTKNKIEEGELMHYLDGQALVANPEGLATILKNNLILQSDHKKLEATIGRVRAYPALQQPPFATLNEAEFALKGPVFHPDFVETYAGDTVVDIELIFKIDKPITDYSIALKLNPGLEKQEETANILLDHATDKPLIFRIRGLLTQPVEISRSVLKPIFSFIKVGFEHILEGTDHVLFILCLVIGVTRIRILVARITGFTLGHSITLSLGFFGYVPQKPWFIPLVEVLIAGSIVYMAIVALTAQKQHTNIFITSVIGLLHGLGFSFVLQKMLSLDSNHLWQSLLGFNIGVELGQLAILGVVFPFLWLITHKRPQYKAMVCYIVALPCIGIATFWIGQRAVLFVNSL